MNIQTESSRAPQPAVRNLNPDDCLFDEDDCEFTIQNSSRPRATAIDNYAREMGVAFQNVTCARRYLRIYSRQEAWEPTAEAAITEWSRRNDPPLTFTARGYQDPNGNIVEPPQFTVPDAWEPGEDTAVWTFCKKSTPGAIACWHLNVRTRSADR
jgi:hypothetical protein